MSLAELQKMIDGVDERKKALREQEQKEFKKALTMAFATIPGLKKFDVFGWTPSFNDGDPCHHSHSVMTDYGDYCDYGLEDYYIAYAEDEDFDGDVEEFKVNKLSEDEDAAISNIFHVWNNAVEREWYTDFRLTFTRDDSKPEGYTVAKDWYSCGY